MKFSRQFHLPIGLLFWVPPVSLKNGKFSTVGQRDIAVVKYKFFRGNTEKSRLQSNAGFFLSLVTDSLPLVNTLTF